MLLIHMYIPLKLPQADAHLACILADFLNCSDMGWQTYLQGSAQTETCTTMNSTRHTSQQHRLHKQDLHSMARET
jgi:hypothetical protein